jgi:hypothetical protein
VEVEAARSNHVESLVDGRGYTRSLRPRVDASLPMLLLIG